MLLCTVGIITLFICIYRYGVVWNGIIFLHHNTIHKFSLLLHAPNSISIKKTTPKPATKKCTFFLFPQSNFKLRNQFYSISATDVLWPLFARRKDMGTVRCIYSTFRAWLRKYSTEVFWFLSWLDGDVTHFLCFKMMLNLKDFGHHTLHIW